MSLLPINLVTLRGSSVIPRLDIPCEAGPIRLYVSLLNTVDLVALT